MLLDHVSACPFVWNYKQVHPLTCEHQEIFRVKHCNNRYFKFSPLPCRVGEYWKKLVFVGGSSLLTSKEGGKRGIKCTHCWIQENRRNVYEILTQNLVTLIHNSHNQRTVLQLCFPSRKLVQFMLMELVKYMEAIKSIELLFDTHFDKQSSGYFA